MNAAVRWSVALICNCWILLCSINVCHCLKFISQMQLLNHCNYYLNQNMLATNASWEDEWYLQQLSRSCTALVVKSSIFISFNITLLTLSFWQSWNPSAAFAVWLPADSDTASGASPIILGLSLEEANFRFRLPSPCPASCLQSDARMELELRNHIYKQVF